TLPAARAATRSRPACAPAASRRAPRAGNERSVFNERRRCRRRAPPPGPGQLAHPLRRGARHEPATRGAFSMSEQAAAAEAQKEGPYRTAADAPKSIVTLRGIHKTFWRGKEPIRVLENLDLDVPNGSFEALMGP